MKIPQFKSFVDKQDYSSLEKVFENNYIAEGPYAKKFHDQLLDIIGAKYGCFASNGTLAIYLGLKALGIKPGDEILVQNITFIASANAVEMLGATPIFVDIPSFNDLTIDITKIKLNPNTKALIIAHLFGTSCSNIEEVKSYCDENGIFLIEDSAQALAISNSEKHCGTYGKFGTFSFYADKTITTAEGGFVVTDDEVLYEKMLYLRNQGRLKSGSFVHPEIGYNFRITDLRGNPEEDLVFDPLKDDERLKVIYGQIVRAKRFQFTKIATVYTGALSIFLLGIYFMISNILAKVKINRMKQDFISSVSHELKTPIAAVKMLAETLRRGKIKDAKRKDQYYNMIIRESDRLTRFINKILDFAKIEKGGKVFYFEEANISELAKTAVDIYKEEAQDESLVLNLNLSKEDIEAEVDQDAILQVILNLMDNAYKYSKDEKNITVNVRENANVVIVEVADKGLGIPKESLEKIFDKFYRAGQYMMDGIKGSGLGLSFVKSVINAHSGKIAVESEVNKGTKFVISLPKKSVQKGG